MEFALFYEIPVARPWNPDSERKAYHDTLEQAVLGDKLGFHSVWTVEHHFLAGVLALLEPRGALRRDRGPHREHPPRLRRAARAEAVQPPGPLGGVGRGARPPQRRSGRVRHRPLVDPHRARGLRRRPGRDPADVAGGARPHRRLLDERRARVRRRVLVDAEAPRAAEAAAGAAPADVGRDRQRRRSPHDGRARPRVCSRSAWARRPRSSRAGSACTARASRACTNPIRRRSTTARRASPW